MQKKYSFVDLFAGCGGLSLGFGNQSFELVFASDISKDALKTLEYNLQLTHKETSKDKIIQADIMELYKLLDAGVVKRKSLGSRVIMTNKELELRRKNNVELNNDKLRSFLSSISSVDVLAGGPPCQGFSMIGRSKKASVEERMNGFIDDPRNQLYKYFLKFAERLNPKIILIENVKGLGSAASYRDLIEKTITETGKGYSTASCVLNAKDFGVPQHRERYFFIGVRSDISKKFKIESNDIFTSILSHTTEALKLKNALDGLPKIKANPLPNNYSQKNEISFSSNKTFGMDVSNLSYQTLVTKSNYINRINTYQSNLIEPELLFNHKSRYNNERDLYIYKNLAPGKYLNDPKNQKALDKVTYGVKIDEDGNKVVKGFADKYFKLDPESPSKTIIAHLETDGNSYVHPGDNPRSISPREAARIQSFPDWFKFTGSLRKQFHQIGNAVPPMLASVIAGEIKNILQKIDS